MLAVIKKDDRLKPVAKKILEKIESGNLKGIYASTASIQEVIFWFYNRQLFSDLTKAVSELTHLKNVEWVAITSDICLTASLLINEYKISPLDAYHAATAMFRDKTILSTDNAYDRIKGIERISLEQFNKNK